MDKEACSAVIHWVAEPDTAEGLNLTEGSLTHCCCHYRCDKKVLSNKITGLLISSTATFIFQCKTS